MALSEVFRKRFVELTDELDLKNKTEIAAALGLTYATFVKIYNYGILPTAHILSRIGDYFNVSIEYLIGNTDNDYFIKSENKVTFQERLEELRKKHNISTVYELSQRLHIHRNNIAQWIKKDYLPSIDDLIIIANLFDTSIDYLIGRTDDDTPY